MNWRVRLEDRQELRAKLKEIREVGEKVAERWYLKEGYFQPSQTIAIFPASLGHSYFEGQQQQLSRIVETWMKRLGLEDKRFLIREETRQSDPDDYELHEELLAMEVSFPY